MPFQECGDGVGVPPGHLTGLETRSPLHPSASKPGSIEWEAGSILRPELGQTQE